MDLLKLLEKQLRKRSVGTLVLNRLNRFREVFFEDDQAYLVDEPFSGKVAVRELFARHIVGQRLSLAKFETIIYSADLSRQLLPEILRDQGVLDEESLRAVAEEQILEEIVDLFLHNTTSFHFQEGRVPEHLLGSASLVAQFSVPLERLAQEFASRVEQRKATAELIPSDQEIFVVTEAGMVHKESHEAGYELRSIFNLIDGMRDLGAVVSDSHLFAFHVYSLIDVALRRGFLKKTIHPELRGFSTSRLSPAQAEQYLPLLKNAVKYGADELAARERLAVIYEMLGRVEDALIQYNFVGDTLCRMDRAPIAIKAYQKALELKPGEPLLIDKMASVYVKLAQDALGREDRALATRLLANVLRMCPDDLETFERLLVLHLADNDLKAVSELIDVVRAYASKISEPELAIEACRKVIARVPRDIGLRKKLVNVYLDCGRNDDAGREMRILAGLYDKSGNAQMAQSLLDKADRLNGVDPTSATGAKGASSAQRARRAGRTPHPPRRGVLAPAGVVLLLLALVYQMAALLAWQDIERRYAHAASLSRTDPGGADGALSAYEKVSRACDRYLRLYPVSAFGRDVKRIRRRMEGPAGAADAPAPGSEEPARPGPVTLPPPRPTGGPGAETAGGAQPAPLSSASPAAPDMDRAARHDEVIALLDEGATLERAGRWWEAAARYREFVKRSPRSEFAGKVRIPVRIASHPPGAQVFLVEGRDATAALGTTPLLLRLASGGFVRLEFRLRDHAPRRLEVTERETAGRRSPLLVVLDRKSSRDAELGGPPTVPPLREGSLLHCPVEGGKVVSVDLATGRLSRWVRPNSTVEHVNRKPLAARDGLYTVWNDAQVLRLHRVSGQLELDGVFRLSRLPSEAALARGRDGRGFVVGTVRSGLQGFDGVTTGDPSWSLQTRGEVTAILELAPGPDGGAGFVVGSAAGSVMKLIVIETTPLVEWERKVADGPVELLARLDAERLVVRARAASLLHVVPVSGKGATATFELPGVTGHVVLEEATRRAYAVLSDASLVWFALGATETGHARLALDEFLPGGASDLAALGEGALALIYGERRAFVVVVPGSAGEAPAVAWCGRLAQPIHSLTGGGGRVVAIGTAGAVSVWDDGAASPSGRE